VDGRAAVKWGALDANVKAARGVMEAKKAKEVLRAENEKEEKKRMAEEEKAVKLNSSPKKRGRPSNAELARRAQEKEALAQNLA
jgi:hypothetical protein